AKERSGQGLARLLNLTDGLLGQGLSLLIVLTTNEPLERLHPAVVRPGRCIAQIEVGTLNEAEARACWVATSSHVLSATRWPTWWRCVTAPRRCTQAPSGPQS